MRKITFLILLVAFIALCLCLASCKDDTNSNDPNTSYIIASDPVESYDNVSVYFPDNESTVEGSITIEESYANQSEVLGFTIKEKHYAFGENKVVLLNIENKTEKDYTLTVKGTYFDRNGNILKTETQTFEDFVNGHQGYFLFNPNIEFTSFSFTLEHKEFTGEPKLSNVKALAWNFETATYQVWPEILPGESGNPENVLYTKWHIVNENNITLHIKSTVIAFDANGEILCISPSGYKEYPASAIGSMDVELFRTIDSLTTDSSSWPQRMQEGIEIIIIPIDAMTTEEFRSYEATLRQ